MSAHDRMLNEVFKNQLHNLKRRKEHWAEVTRRYDDGEISWEEYRQEYEKNQK